MNYDLASIANWFARAIVADEVRFVEPIPVALRLPTARAMVEDSGEWPDEESALAFLDELYEWDRS